MISSKSKLVGAILFSVLGVASGYFLAIAGWSWLASDDESSIAEQFESEIYSEDDEGGSDAEPGRDAIESRLQPSSAEVVVERMESEPLQMLPFNGGGPDRLPGGCEAGSDPTEVDAGVATLTTSCTNLSQATFGGLYRQFNASSLQGRRVRFSAELRSDDLRSVGGIDGMASIWMRIDATGAPIVESGRDRGLSGTNDWESREIVVTVPETASLINVGFWMQGSGQVWAKNVKLEIL